MFLSIIVPAYNVENYLKKCIDSLLIQNIDDYEIIILNDCSTDATLEVAKSFNDKKIRVIDKKTNTGLSDTRNIGIEYASGEYIMFVDSDDSISENCLREIADFISIEKTDIVYLKYNLVKNGYSKKIEHFSSDSNKVYEASEFLKRELANRILPIAACFAVYKKSFLVENGLKFQVGYLHEDELWTPMCLLKAKRVGTLDCYYYNYIIRENSITQKKNKTKNGIDLLRIAKTLDGEADEITDSWLKKLFKNHVAMIYMKAVSRGNLCKTEYNKEINRLFPIRREYFFKDKLKSFFFLCNPYVYSKIDKRYGNNI